MQVEQDSSDTYITSGESISVVAVARDQYMNLVDMSHATMNYFISRVYPTDAPPDAAPIQVTTVRD